MPATEALLSPTPQHADPALVALRDVQLSRIFGQPQSERTRAFLHRASGEGPRSHSVRPMTSIEPVPFNRLRFAL